MTIERMLSWFDIIQDKSNSPYFTDLEKVEFINRAQTKFINEIVFGQFIPSMSKGERQANAINSFESVVQGSEALEPLFLSDLAITSSAGGEITRTQINSAINSETSGGEGYLYLLNIARDFGAGVVRNVRFVRHNDYFRFKENDFKKPTTNSPVYRIERQTIKIDPAGAFNYLISVIKEPLDCVYDSVTPANNIDCELPEFTHDEILSIALSDAGVASRDEALIALKSAAENN